MIHPTGLSERQASELLTRDGFNELPSAKSKNIWTIAGQVVKEPMFLLLITCGVLYMILGDYQEGLVLSSSIFLIIAITFYQYRKTEVALQALKNLSSPRALVIRDGIEKRIAGRDVVTGDVLLLQEGDRVPADGVLIESEHLLIDESLLTGESVPVNKTTNGNKDVMELPGGENNFNVFSGTMVLRGKGYARVLKTGTHTQMGKIGLALHQVKSQETRLQEEMKKVIRRFGLIGILLSLSVVISYYLTRGELIKALLTGLASAMAILPEEFPVVLTVFLALGAWRMSRKNVLTRIPAAIETLGSATVLCSDKTGTITQNNMRVMRLFDGHEILSVDSSIEFPDSFKSLVETGSLACAEKTIDPMEKAIVQLYHQNVEDKPNFEIIRTYPITREILAMANAHRHADDIFISMKGALEAIALLCGADETTLKNYFETADAFARDGLRVIAVARDQRATLLPEQLTELNCELIGLIGLEDPIRPEVPAAVEECRKAGVKVKMITGDYPLTASSIGKQIGLDPDKILTGKEISEMSDQALCEKISDTAIFARVLPEQKLKIVQALQANGEVVAMTGDGVNDAPALKAANIGIAMGKKGTDVARESAALVLLDDNFASIVKALRLGRRIYDNLRKAMIYILAIHIPIIGLSLIPAFFSGLPAILLPLHIVFLEMLIDPVCSIAFEIEPDEMGLMTRQPRNRDERFFGNKQIIRGLLNGMIILGMVLTVYALSIREGHTETEVRAITFTSLILANIGFILSSISNSRNVFMVIGERNPAVKIILSIAVFMLLIVLFVPFTQELFQFSSPALRHFILPLAGSMGVILIFELRKFWLKRNAQERAIPTGQ